MIKNRIKEKRIEMKLTQEEVSKLTGIPKRTIENWETGVRQPSDWVVDLVVNRLIQLEEMIQMGIALRTYMVDEDDARDIVVNDIIHDYLTDCYTEYGYTLNYLDESDCAVIYRKGKDFEILTDEDADEFCKEHKIY